MCATYAVPNEALTLPYARLHTPPFYSAGSRHIAWMFVPCRTLSNGYFGRIARYIALADSRAVAARFGPARSRVQYRRVARTHRSISATE